MKRKVAALCLAMAMVMGCGISSSMALVAPPTIAPVATKTLQKLPKEVSLEADDGSEKAAEWNRKHLEEVFERNLKERENERKRTRETLRKEVSPQLFVKVSRM